MVKEISQCFRFYMNSGARVQELVDLKLKDVRFIKAATVTAYGKGINQELYLYADTIY